MGPASSARLLASRVTRSRDAIALRRDHPHLGLDPALHLVVDRHHVAPFSGDERADDHLYRAALLLERVARPILAGVVRDRQDRRSGARGEQRAPDSVAAGLPWRDARALGEDRHPVPLLQALGALRHDLLARAAAARAVDGDRADRHEPPAHERQPQQFLLHDPALRRERALDEDRLPRRLVLRHDDHRELRHVLPAAHLVGDGAAHLDPLEHHLRVEACERERRLGPEDAPEGNEAPERRRDEESADEEHDRAQRGHGCAMRWRLASARSSKTRVFLGMPPSAWVPFPLPVSTRIGCAPTVSAACRSFRLSPMAGTPFSSVWKRAAISSSMPVRGFLQAQASTAVCGQKKSASMRPPCRNTISIILSLIAFSVAMSNRPRPMPDWVVATAMR